MRRQHLSNAKYGHMSTPPRAIKVLAEILDMDPADIWIIQQQRLNPFTPGRAPGGKRSSLPAAASTFRGPASRCRQ
jgi:hypothetical protein